MINVSGSGCIAPKIEDKDPTSFRVACYPDGSTRMQGCYQWSKGHKWGHVWKDLSLVLVDADGQEYK